LLPILYYLCIVKSAGNGHSSLTIQQVCYKCGFNDVPHFCRIFKRMFQITPKEFRKRE